MNFKVLKKNGILEEYDFSKIKNAVTKSAARVDVKFNQNDWDQIEFNLRKLLGDVSEVTVEEMHNVVEQSLEMINPKVAKSYKDYRNYKKDYAAMMEKVLANADELNYKIDKSNANTTAALISTKRSLIYTGLNRERYKTFELNKTELSAIEDGYIYIHDLGARSDTYNCFSRDTKFITTEGLRSFEDYNDGDQIKVIDADGNVQNAVVHCYGEQMLNKVIFKRCSKGFKTIYVTANHRWLLKDGSETTNLKVKDKLKLAPNFIASFDTMSVDELKAWCYGFILADGSQQHYSSKHGDADYDYSFVRLCGKKNKYAEYFTKAGYNVTHPDSMHGDGYIYCRDFNKFEFNESKFKNYTYSQLKAMAYGYMCADGNNLSSDHRNSNFNGLSCTGDHNEWLVDLLSLAGFYITNITDMTGHETNYGVIKSGFAYGLHNDQGCRGYVVQSIEPYEKQSVWCLEVENSHSFILEGGIPTGNCCLFDMGKVLQGGFEWEHIGYNEPKDVRTACNLISDITLNCAAQQYGGFTIPEIDSILAPYARKSYKIYEAEYKEIVLSNKPSILTDTEKLYIDNEAHEYAMKKVERDIAQGFQGFEHTFNTVASSRGDFPFVTMSGGCEEDEFGQLVWKTALRVRREGQGHPGNKRPAIFPKLVFLYTKELHNEGKPLYDEYKEGVISSSQAMYPDWLSLDIPDPSDIKTAYVLDVKSPVAEIFHKYHKFGVSRWILDDNNNVQENPEWVDSVISPMGAARGDETVSIKIHDKEYENITIKTAFDLILDATRAQDNHGGRHFEGQAASPFRGKCGVYKLTDLKSGLFYIGSSKDIDRRFIEHRSAFKHKGSLGDNYFINNYDLNDLKLEVLEECNIDDLFEVESKYIDFKHKDEKCVNFKDPINNGNFNSETRLTALKGESYSTYENRATTWTKKINDPEIMVRSSNEYVPIRTLIRNTPKSPLEMYEVTYVKNDEYISLNITEDHPLHTPRGRIRADELEIGDKVIDCLTGDLYPIESIIKTGEKCFTYDFETDNDKFDLSGIVSHNCRAYLSAYYESGNLCPVDENDKPIFHGRFNGGAVSLNLPMIYQKAKLEDKDFFDELRYYCDMIDGIHIKTYHFLSKLKASCNPVAFCEGGFGKLDFDDEIKPLVDRITFSYGFTALNELQELATGQSLYDVRNDKNSIALKAEKFVADYVNEKKQERIEGKVPYIAAIYATPAESLCGTQLEQFRKKYGIIKNVSDRAYFTNSFHMWVGEEITPYEKQDAEFNYFHISSGGHIQYCRFPNGNNLTVLDKTIRRAMKLGFYFGVNIESSYCGDCGCKVDDSITECPCCRSHNITTINRVCGYLGYSRVDGTTKMNDAKMAEIKDRKSM